MSLPNTPGGADARLVHLLAESREDYERLGMAARVPPQARDLTAEDRLVIFEWTRDVEVSDTFRRVNVPLYRGDILPADFAAFAEALDAALEKLPIYPRDVYRGVPAEYLPLDLYQIGGIVHWGGFASTSKEQIIAFGRPTASARIIVEGHTGRDIEDLSANGSVTPLGGMNEREVLIPSGCFVEVLGRNKLPSGVVELIVRER
jgi:hypothetical protein